MTWTTEPRPADPTAELVRSRDEQQLELRLLGLRGVRAIRARLRLVESLKRTYGDEPIPPAVLDQVVEPVACRRTRVRFGAPRHGSHGIDASHRPRNGLLTRKGPLE